MKVRIAKLLCTCLALVAVAASASEQLPLGTLRVNVFLVDQGLNIKPVPRHVVVLTPMNGGEPLRLVTAVDGIAEVQLPPGTYALASDRPVNFEGRSYEWRATVDVKSGQTTPVDLSADNAIRPSIDDAMDAISRGDPSLAWTIASQLSSDDPENYEALVVLGIAEHFRGNNALAVEHLRRITFLRAQLPELWMRTAHLFLAASLADLYDRGDSTVKRQDVRETLLAFLNTKPPSILQSSVDVSYVEWARAKLAALDTLTGHWTDRGGSLVSFFKGPHDYKLTQTTRVLSFEHDRVVPNLGSSTVAGNLTETGLGFAGELEIFLSVSTRGAMDVCRLRVAVRLTPSADRSTITGTSRIVSTEGVLRGGGTSTESVVCGLVRQTYGTQRVVTLERTR